jgi:hypothetical protein
MGIKHVDFASHSDWMAFLPDPVRHGNVDAFAAVKLGLEFTILVSVVLSAPFSTLCSRVQNATRGWILCR